MKHSDVFKLSTLATAIFAIMPAIANAADTDTVIKDPKIIQGSNTQTDTDKTKTKQVAIGTATDAATLTGNDQATSGLVESGDVLVNVAGIYVGKKDASTPLTAEYTGGNENIVVNPKIPGFIHRLQCDLV